MKVELKDIKPNPYRYINKGYPIDKAKVEKLRASIKRTGFWDNLVARKNKNGDIEIAYGHHRIEACRQEFKPSYEIDVILRVLDDATMLKIMAAENDSMDIMSPAVINETVRATMEFLKDVKAGFDENKARKNGLSIQGQLVADFLNWAPGRIQSAMKALHAIEKGHVEKEEYESIPYQESAEIFRHEVRKLKPSDSARKVVIEKLKSGEIGKRAIRKELLKAQFPNGKDGKKDIMLEDVSSTVASKIRECSTLLTDNFIANANHLSEESIMELSTAVGVFYKKLQRLKNKLHSKSAKLLEVVK